MSYENFRDYAIGVVAHVDRVNMAQRLSASVNAKLVNVDDGALGCSGNHGFVLSRLVSEPGWSVILEDDAVPLNFFCDDLEWVLEHAPTPIVSLYLGTGYPSNWQHRITEALIADTSWIICPRLIHAVGYAIAPDIKGELSRWMSANKRGPGMPPDDAISTWASAHGVKVAYTNPSLVDHRDTPTVILARYAYVSGSTARNRARHAHNTRQRLTWDDSAVEMTH